MKNRDFIILVLIIIAILYLLPGCAGLTGIGKDAMLGRSHHSKYKCSKR